MTTVRLSDDQRKTLDAVYASLIPHAQFDGGGRPAVLTRIERLIGTIEDPRDRQRLRLLLSVLGSRAANLLMSARPRALANMNLADRERALDAWAHSSLPIRRAGFQALKRLINVAHYCWPDADGSHPSWRATGYPGPLPPPDGPGVTPLPTTHIDRTTELDADIVIVGSGAGGGVAAGVLAGAGKNIVVLEKGDSVDTRRMTQIEGEMLGAMYLGGGLIMTQSGSMPILAGSCLGGGTTVNYTTSFPLPARTRAEWDARSGLSLFSSARFTESLERVQRRLDVGTRWTTASARDTILETGCRRLGWHVGTIPRNVTGCREGLECGYCGYGCRYGAKNSTERTYLNDAAHAGARLVVRCNVERVLMSRGRAAGVVGTVTLPDGTTCELTVRARVVIVACGAVSTPALLRRSGLQNPHIGRGLRLHPVTGVFGTFPDRVEPWSGALQTRFSDQFADLDSGYGAKFETAPIHFALPASAFGWDGARRYREAVERLAHTGVVGILLRDRDAGRVTVSRSGHPRVDYELSDYDVRHLRTALHGAARVLAAAGATEVETLQTPPTRMAPKSNWFENFVRATDARGYRHCRMSYITFHQMASAAMGADPKTSVIQETGEAYEVRGLFVADGSAFPTSSGVNPMITIMALADHIARGINERW